MVKLVGTAISTMIGARHGNTVQLSAMVAVIAVPLSLALGLLAAMYPGTEFQGTGRVAFLGTDYMGRCTLSRILWGARTTIGISLASTIIVYLVGVTLGIAAAVGGGMIDMSLSRVNDAFMSIPHIMLGLVVIAAIGSTIPILIVLTGLI